MAPGDLLALRAKYETLAALRARREAVEAAGQLCFDDDEVEARRVAFREVAAIYPGALRELQITTAAVLRAKRDAVDAAAAGRAPVAAWMRLVLEFHAFVREVLALKRWVAERCNPALPLSDEDVAACLAWFAGRGGAGVGSGSDHGSGAETAGAWDGSRAALEHWRRPAGGRFLPHVVAILAARHGVDTTTVAAAIFGRPDGI